MTATADGWSINRTGGYRNSEYASIVLQGSALNAGGFGASGLRVPEGL